MLIAVSVHECRGIRAAFYQVIIVLRPSKLRELKNDFIYHLTLMLLLTGALSCVLPKTRTNWHWVRNGFIFSPIVWLRTKHHLVPGSCYTAMNTQWNLLAIMTIFIRKKPFCPLLHPTVVSAVCSWRLEVCIWRKPTKICSFTNHTESSGESEWRDSKHNKPLLST